ncbi:MAG: PH domain-containing protein [Patescibacteria group bacterium]
MLNQTLIKRVWLKKDEVPILVIRSSMANWLAQYLLSLVLLAVVFFLMYYFWQYGVWGLAAFAVVIIFSSIIIIRACYEHYFTGWVLTNLRLIDLYQRGFLRRELTEVVYNKIKDVHAEKHGWLGLGDIFVTLVDSRVRLGLEGVRGFDRAVSEIVLQQENYQKNLLNEKEQRAQYLLAKLKKRLGEAEFYRLLGD